ncbi:MAG: alpha/beta hydrolase [archaeon]|nr:alpha/beta hydrolase [archaeon]
MPYYRNKNNLNLYYKLIEEQDAKIPIVMLHGFGSSAGFFKEQINLLKKRNKIIVFDAEGHGKSEINPKEKIEAHLITSTVDDLLELLYILNIDEPVGIIGHSLVGGCIAQKMALLHPEKVKFLVLLNSGTMYIDNPIRNIFWNLLPQRVRMNFNHIIQENLEILLDKTLPFIRGAILKDKLHSDFFYDKLDGIIESEIFDMIKNPMNPSTINCPTIIIGGELDNYAPIWMSKEISQKIQNSRIETIPMAGHFGPSHRSSAYNEIIINFFNDFGF